METTKEVRRRRPGLRDFGSALAETGIEFAKGGKSFGIMVSEGIGIGADSLIVIRAENARDSYRNLKAMETEEEELDEFEKAIVEQAKLKLMRS